MSKKVDSVYVHSFGRVNCYQAGPEVYEWGLKHQPGIESVNGLYYGTWAEWLAEKKRYQSMSSKLRG